MLDILNRQSEIVKNIMIYTSKLRSTKGYQRAYCGQLLATVVQTGTPTINFPLSGADYQQPYLFKLLEPNKSSTELTDAECR